MSQHATVEAYARILTDPGYRRSVAMSGALENDLSEDEKRALEREAAREVTPRNLGSGPIMALLRSGPPLPASAARALGIAMNQACGLPTESLKGPGFTSGSSACCPWGHPTVPDPAGMLEE